MNTKIKRTSKLSDEDLRREKKITSKLNLKKLPFKVGKTEFFIFNTTRDCNL